MTFSRRPAYTKPSPTRAQQRCAVQMLAVQGATLDLTPERKASICRSYDMKPDEVEAIFAAERKRRAGL